MYIAVCNHSTGSDGKDTGSIGVDKSGLSLRIMGRRDAFDIAVVERYHSPIEEVMTVESLFPLGDYLKKLQNVLLY